MLYIIRNKFLMIYFGTWELYRVFIMSNVKKLSIGNIDVILYNQCYINIFACSLPSTFKFHYISLRFSELHCEVFVLYSLTGVTFDTLNERIQDYCNLIYDILNLLSVIFILTIS